MESSECTEDNELDDLDDDLPEINLSPSKIDNSFTVDSIVWAIWKKKFWPALVRNCYPKQKKMSVVYVDLPLKENGKEHRFSVRYQNVLRFDSSVCSNKLLEDGLSGNDGVLKSAIERAKNYLMKKANGGMLVSSVQFLQDPLSDLLAESESENPPSSTAEEAEASNNETDEEAPISDCSDADETPCDFENSSLPLTRLRADVDDDSDDQETMISSPFKRPNSDLNDKIMSAIKSEDCKRYVLRIWKGEEESSRHRTFMSPKRVKLKKKKVDAFCYQTILKLSQVEDVINYLKPLVEKTNADPLFPINYAMDVLAPEAVTFALQTVLKVSKSEAEDILSGGYVPDDLLQKLTQ